MKKLFCLIFILQFTTLTFAEKNEKPVKSEITDVTVYLSGATVSRTGSTQIGAGLTYLVFEDLAPGINPSTIQCKAIGNFTIMSVNFRTNYLSGEKIPKEVKILRDSIELLSNRIIAENDNIQVLRAEEDMIISNKKIGGNDNGVSIEALMKNADFFRTRLADIRKKVAEGNFKLKKLAESLDRINDQINQIQSKQKQNSGEIVIGVSAPAATTAKVTVSFLAYNAGWYPNYDIRAIDVKSDVELVFKAKVYQSTGNEWNNVNLKLSTCNPQQSGSKPIMNPWFLYLYENTPYRAKSKGYVNTRSESAKEAKMEEMDASTGGAAYDEVPATTIADYTVVNEGQTSMEYEISIPYSIYSDNKPYDVEIQKNKLPATYTYFAIPKLDPDAFLLARISGWDKFNLMSGEANIFFEGTYVGKSYIDVATADDTLDISLGRDKNIIVKRTKLTDYTSKKIIGSNRKITYGFEYEVRNKKKADIDIIIEDQSPITTSKEIEIEKDEISGAEFDESTGKLSWKLTIKPGETKKFVYKYSIKYPKDKFINL